MRVKSLELDSTELIKTLTVNFSEVELDFIKNHLDKPVTIISKKKLEKGGVQVKLSIKSAAKIAKACGKMSQVTSPNHEVSSELYEGFSNIINRFYDEGYSEIV